MIYEHYFEGRKPSLLQVKVAIFKALREGYNMIEISWGENMLTIERNGVDYYGWGWIKDISGGDLANELNKEGA